MRDKSGGLMKLRIGAHGHASFIYSLRHGGITIYIYQASSHLSHLLPPWRWILVHPSLAL